jgi:hypothetical protein
LGGLFILGGIVADLGATIYHSPDLQQEANPIARALLDSGHSLATVYIIGLTGQALIALIGCTWWAALLAHRKAWLSRAMALRPSSYLEFVRLASGGGELTWRQILLPYKTEDFVVLYRTAYWWFLVTFNIIFLDLTLGRYYIALVWFRVLPHHNIILMTLAALVPVMALVMVWLYAEYTARLPPPGKQLDETPPPPLS